jgi:hypothetical protein
MTRNTGARRTSRTGDPFLVNWLGARRATVRRSKQASESGDPWQAPDPALALALRQMKWFAKHRDRARLAYQLNEVLILLTTATTTVTAALKVSTSATTILAASTVVLAGLYKVLDSHENWLAFASAWAELQAIVNDYRMLPADERDEDAQRKLIGRVNDINTAETGRWVSRRHSFAAGG